MFLSVWRDSQKDDTISLYGTMPKMGNVFVGMEGFPKGLDYFFIWYNA